MLGRVKRSKLGALVYIKECPWSPKANQVVSTVGWNEEKCASPCNVKKCSSKIKILQGSYYGNHLKKICSDKAKIKLAIPLNDSMELLSFNGGVNNFNFCFRKEKILLVIDNKTSNLSNKTTAKRINQLWMERLWRCSWFKGFTSKNIFAVTGKSANNTSIVSRILGEPYRQ